MSETEYWSAHMKGGEGNFEVTVCFGKPDISWGWYGPRKLRMEGGGLEEQMRRAHDIAEALNAHGVLP